LKSDDDLYSKPGLVRDYAPFIYKQVRKPSKLYLWLSYSEILAEATRLARIAERRFDRKCGHDFSTFLRWHLKGLSRWAKQHPDYRWWRDKGDRPPGRPRKRLSAVYAAPKEVRRMLLLNRADPDFVRTVIEYMPDGNNPAQVDIGTLRRVADARANRFAKVVLDAAAAKPPNGNNDAIVLEWILDGLRGADDRTAAEFARDVGLTKGAVSKIRTRLVERLELHCDRKKRNGT
jgi:hypothetical protein